MALALSVKTPAVILEIAMGTNQTTRKVSPFKTSAMDPKGAEELIGSIMPRRKQQQTTRPLLITAVLV